jgi:hypothetical protein
MADPKAPIIMTLFARYLSKAPPTKSLEAKDATARIPISTPISLSFEPDFVRYMGRVGTSELMAARGQNRG